MFTDIADRSPGHRTRSHRAGTTAAPHGLDAPTSAHRKVIVVGAGLSGLTAAHRLRAAGYGVHVLEAADRIGGRVSTFEKEGVLLDTGLQFIGPREPYENTFELLENLGLSSALEPTSAVAALVRRGRVYTYSYGSIADFLRLPVLSLPSKLRLVSVYPEVKRHAALLDFRHLEKAESLDDQDAAHYVTHLVGRDAWEHLIAPLMGVFYYYPPEGVSRAFLMVVVSSIGDLETYCLAGGNAVLAERLAAGLSITPGAIVERVASERGGASVTWKKAGRSHHESAAAVIVATSADIAARLCPSLSTAEQQFLESVTYTACIGVATCTQRSFGKGMYGVAIASGESKLLAGVTFEENKGRDRVPAGLGLTIAYLNARSSRALMDTPAEEIAARNAAEMERFWPGHNSSTLWTHLFRHRSATPFFGVGSIRRLKAFLDRPDPTPHLYFCGDYLCGPHMEGAITSGIRAADAVMGKNDSQSGTV